MSDERKFGPFMAVTFEAESADPRKAVWSVDMQEDGSLRVTAIGRGCTRVMAMSAAHSTFVITTERIVKENAR